jgi:diketogulonate reductase-like aldo/keto reductase
MFVEEVDYGRILGWVAHQVGVACNSVVYGRAQLALAWLWKQGEELGVDVVPIPGTTKIKNVQSNCSAVGVSITETELAELSSAFDGVVGERGFEDYMRSTYRITTNVK